MRRADALLSKRSGTSPQQGPMGGRWIVLARWIVLGHGESVFGLLDRFGPAWWQARRVCRARVCRRQLTGRSARATGGSSSISKASGNGACPASRNQRTVR